MRIVNVDRPMQGYLRRYTVLQDHTYHDFNVYSNELEPLIADFCEQLRQELQSFKLQVRSKLKFYKTLDIAESCEAFFSNRQSTILPATNINNEIGTIINQIKTRIEEFCENGSDWTVSEISGSDIHIARY